MNEDTFHHVHGVGVEAPTSEFTFHPEYYEQAARGLENILMTVREIDDRADKNTPNHTFHTTEDGTNTIQIAENTVLSDVIACIPSGWEVSIVEDASDAHNNSYCVFTRAYCGGDVRLYAKIFVENDRVRRTDVGYTDLADTEHDVEITSLSQVSTRDFLRVVRGLERSIIQAYAAALPSAAKTLDYALTKRAVGQEGSRPIPEHLTSQVEFTQKDWAATRGNTQQSVSNNVSDARASLRELDTVAPFRATGVAGPALTEIQADADEAGVVRLV
ncbi:hypothetical protein [Salinibaculum rarum]|uniref:hypothetical protein n=1 Tax=Salinibaculum rarum TaxID=3058903 RepID=UPI00265F7744|nr:hypothetical protein [Salinibaculum sp. KK48]